MNRLATAGEVGIFRTSRQNAMRTHVHPACLILLLQNVSIRGQKHRNRVRHQQNARDHCPASFVQTLKPYARIFQVYRIHQLVKRDVSLISGQTQQGWSGKPDGGGQGFVAVTGKANIEPDDIRLQPADFAQQAGGIGQTIEVPAADDVVAGKFRLRLRQFIGQDGEAQQRIALQFPRYVKPVFVQPATARRKGGDKTDFHREPGLKNASRESLLKRAK